MDARQWVAVITSPLSVIESVTLGKRLAEWLARRKVFSLRYTMKVAQKKQFNFWALITVLIWAPTSGENTKRFSLIWWCLFSRASHAPTSSAKETPKDTERHRKWFASYAKSGNNGKNCFAIIARWRHAADNEPTHWYRVINSHGQSSGTLEKSSQLSIVRCALNWVRSRVAKREKLIPNCGVCAVEIKVGSKVVWKSWQIRAASLTVILNEPWDDSDVTHR